MGQTNNRLGEAYDEFRSHLMGRNKLLDTILPPLVFMLVNTYTVYSRRLWSALILAAVITTVRLAKRQTLLFALSGFGGVLLAVLLGWWMARAESYFLPNIIFNGVIVLIAVAAWCCVSPWWQWPAPSPINGHWRGNAHRACAQPMWRQHWPGQFSSPAFDYPGFFYQSQSVNALGTFQILTGTPSTIVLLVLSYLYGIWRLQRLKGPGVAEFMRGAPPPWEGQQRGF